MEEASTRPAGVVGIVASGPSQWGLALAGAATALVVLQQSGRPNTHSSLGMRRQSPPAHDRHRLMAFAEHELGQEVRLLDVHGLVSVQELLTDGCHDVLGGLAGGQVLCSSDAFEDLRSRVGFAISKRVVQNILDRYDLPHAWFGQAPQSMNVHEAAELLHRYQFAADLVRHGRLCWKRTGDDLERLATIMEGRATPSTVRSWFRDLETELRETLTYTDALPDEPDEARLFAPIVGSRTQVRR